MNKELEALKNIKKTIIHTRRNDGETVYYYVGNIPSIKKDFDIIERALKRLEKFDKWVEKLKEDNNYAIQLSWETLELNELYDPQPFKTLDNWDYWGE